MTKEEFEARIELDELVEVHDGDGEKIYISGDRVAKDGEWVNNETNAYGCYRGGNGNYVIFITDNERGIPKYIDTFDTAEEAYDELFDQVSLLNRIYKNKI